MSKFLISVQETYRADTETEATNLIEEAKNAFNPFIESQCAGKERGKIRIILSGK